MNKKKIMSLIMALVMLVGVFSPLTALAAEEETETLTVHKILMTKEGLKNHDVNKEGYNGNKIENIQTFFETSAKEIDGVYFKLQKLKDTVKKEEVDVNKDEQWEDIAGKAGLTGSQKDENKKKLEGYTFDTKGLKGQFRIVEVHEKSTYKGDNGETLTDKKAVPSLVTLPLVNDNGVVKEAHVYPKNTEEKPTTNKDFSDKFTEGQNGRDEKVDEKTIQDNPENSEKEKKANWEPKNVGDTVNYTVRTTIPAKANYATAYWNDEMTDGLDLDINSVKLEYTGNTDVTLTKGTDYTIKPTSNEGKQGFELEFTTTGLEKINGKENEGVITITYSAKLNEKAVVAVPESNDVNFYYGNNPRKGNTPKPNYPDDSGKLKVTKTWADGEWAENEKATFRIVDAQTGKTVTKDDLVGAPEGYVFNAEKEIGYGKKAQSAEWKYLNKNKQYKIVEVSVTDNDGNTVTGWEANYVVNGKGETEVTNYKTNNPEPLNPTEPKVVTGGAKFVKTNADGTERLPGAEFVIKKTVNGKDVFLTGTAADRTAYETAQTAFVDAIKAYNEAIKDDKAIGTENKVTIGNVEYETDADAKAAIAKLEKARDDAWNATLKDMTQWNGTSKEDTNNIKLTSNELGQFEIAGLKPGKYTLVEVKAPEGYALPSNAEFEFEIGDDGLQKVKDIDFGVLDDTKDDNAMKIVNKKVTIPQTGGIGTVLFTIVGISLMAGAVVAMKRNREEA